MPNRIIKETICTSETIDKLNPLEETAFYRLLVNCDDYGRMDGRASILKARLFPLRDVRTDQLLTIMKKLASVELVAFYEVDGKPFIQTVSWDKHQQIRAKRSKYPAPDINGYQMISDDSICTRNPIQSESNPNPNPESEYKSESIVVDKPPRIQNTKALSESFESLWSLYPRKAGKPAAYKSYLKAHKDGVTDEAIRAGIEAYNREITITGKDPQFIRMGSTWFNQRGWEDQYQDKVVVPRTQPGKKPSCRDYTQRTYDEIDLNKWAGKMIEEAQGEKT